MIVINIEMWPSGRADRKYHLGRAYIWNKGGTDKRGDYDGAIMRKGITKTPQAGGHIQRSTEVLNYPRLSYPIWELIRRFLNEALK